MPLLSNELFDAAYSKGVTEGNAEYKKKLLPIPSTDEDESMMMDVMKAPFRGVLQAAESMTFGAVEPGTINVLGRSKTGAGMAVEGISEFATAFIPYLGVLGRLGKVKAVAAAASKLGKAKTLVKWEAASVLADFTAFDPFEARLSDLLQTVPALENPVSEYLASNKDDSQAEGRMKRALEGMLASGAIMGTVAGIKGMVGGVKFIKKAREGRALGRSAEDVMDDLAPERLGLEDAVVGIRAEQESAGLLARNVDEARASAARAVDGVLPETRIADEAASVRELSSVVNERPLSDLEVTRGLLVSGEQGPETVKAVNAVVRDATELRRRQTANAEAKAERPDRARGREALLQRIVMATKDGNLSEATSKSLVDLVNKVDSALLGDVAVSVRGASTGPSSFDFADALVTLTQRAGNDGGKTGAHEFWHSLSRYLPEKELEQVTKEYEKELAAHLKQNPDFLALVGRYTLNQSQYDEYAKFASPESLKSLTKQPNGSYRIAFTKDNYRFLMVDEFFAEKMMDLTMKKQAIPDSFTGRMAKLLQEFFDSVKGKLGFDPYERFYQRTTTPGSITQMERGGALAAARPIYDPAGNTGSRSIRFSATGAPGAAPSSVADFASDFTPAQLNSFQEAAKTGDTAAARDVLMGRKYPDKKDGFLINLDLFEGSTEAQKAIITLAQGFEEMMKKTKADFLLSASQREEMVAVIKGAYGEGPAFNLLKDASTMADISRRVAAHHMALLDVGHSVNAASEAMIRADAAMLKARGAGDITAAATAELERRVQGVRLAERLPLLKQMVVADASLGSATGSALANRRWNRYASLDASGNPVYRQNNELPINFINHAIESSGGEDALLATARKMQALAGEHGPTAAFKLAPKDFWIRAHNEMWLAAILSGPRTFATNALGPIITSVWLPLEKAVGLTMMNATNPNPAFLAARKELLSFSFLFDQFTEAFRMGKLSYAEESGRLLGNSSPMAELGRKVITAENLKAQNPTLAGMVDFFGAGTVDSFGKNVVRQPFRFLTGADEFFKQINYRSAAKVKATMEAHEHFKGVGTAEQIAGFVADKMEKVILENGRRYSSANIRNMVAEEGHRLGKSSAEIEADILKRLEEFDPTVQGLADYADDVAREATFTRVVDDGLGGALMKAKTAVPWITMVLPFVSTPTNIMRFVAQRIMPADLPLIRGLHSQYMKEVNSADPLLRAAAQGRFASGSAFAMMAVFAAAQGHITGGGGDNADERALKRQTGWLPYSIKIGDTYVGYQRADPISSFLGLAADLVEKAGDSKSVDEGYLQDVFVGMVMAASRNVTNKSYLTGISQFVELLQQPGRYTEKFVNSRVGSYIPAFIPQLASSMWEDPYTKEARSMLDLRPRFGLGDARRNVLGEKIEKAQQLGANALSPFTVSSYKNDMIMDEIAKAQHAFALPAKVSEGGLDYTKYVNGADQTAFDRWMELTGTVKVQGRDLRRTLQDVIKTTEYKKLSDIPDEGFTSPRAKELQRVITRFRIESKAKMLKEFPQLDERTEIVRRINTGRREGADVSALLQQLSGL